MRPSYFLYKIIRRPPALQHDHVQVGKIGNRKLTCDLNHFFVVGLIAYNLCLWHAYLCHENILIIFYARSALLLAMIRSFLELACWRSRLFYWIDGWDSYFRSDETCHSYILLCLLQSYFPIFFFYFTLDSKIVNRLKRFPKLFVFFEIKCNWVFCL